MADIVRQRACTQAEGDVHLAFRQRAPQCGCRPSSPIPHVYRILSLLIALPLCLAMSPAALADGERDHDRARAALRTGEVLPLGEILVRVAQQQPGQVLDVELEREQGRWIYELKLLQGSGALVKLEVDARDGRVLRRKGNDKSDGKSDGKSYQGRK
jgi:Peptidase propeptide and YPEB domain